jgi:hypothetical protein
LAAVELKRMLWQSIDEARITSLRRAAGDHRELTRAAA